MASNGTPREIRILMTNHYITITAIERDLQWFADRLVQKQFIDEAGANKTLRSELPSLLKASQLMESVFVKVNHSRDWFNRFIEIHGSCKHSGKRWVW